MSPRRIGLAVAVLALVSAAGAARAQEAPRPQDATEEAVEAGKAEHRRDPFRPFLLDLRPEVVKVPLTPLQQFELGQLTVSGVVWALDPPRAMLQDNNGMGYIVIPGTPIGRHGGTVRAIEPTRVIVEEKTFDYYGNETVRQTVLELPRENKPQDTAARE